MTQELKNCECGGVPQIVVGDMRTDLNGDGKAVITIYCTKPGCTNAMHLDMTDNGPQAQQSAITVWNRFHNLRPKRRSNEPHLPR